MRCDLTSIFSLALNSLSLTHCLLPYLIICPFRVILYHHLREKVVYGSDIELWKIFEEHTPGFDISVLPIPSFE